MQQLLIDLKDIFYHLITFSVPIWQDFMEICFDSGNSMFIKSGIRSLQE